MLEHWIWLATRPGVTDRDRVSLIDYFEDPEEIFGASLQQLQQVPGIRADAVMALKDRDLTEAKKILEQCENKKLNIVTYGDAQYPDRLRQIPDPPMVLYYKGTWPDFDSHAVIGMVGTRRASAYGLSMGKKLGFQIGACGGLVVSGMASGVDAMCMEGALLGGSTVVAVLGCGADVIYPKKNTGLYEDLVGQGCVISEFPPETEPYSWNFPRRNRIISGLSVGVLVVEAPQKSGALITARKALDQGRDVFVIPGNVDIPTFQGSMGLLREGAAAVATGWDVMSEYEGKYAGVRQASAPVFWDAMPESGEQNPMPKVAQIPQKPRVTPHAAQRREKISIDKAPASPYSDLKRNCAALTENEQKILALVPREGKLTDDIVAESQLPAGVALAAITMLQIKGILVSLPGRRVAWKE